MKRNAFTLIELLVVIAIIAILAAILFPVFSRARAKAQQAHCVSNCKQISLAFRMYAADYNDMMPSNPPVSGYGYAFWKTGAAPNNTSVLAAYLQNEQVWYCPSQEGGGGGASTSTATPAWPDNNWHGLCVQTFYVGWGLSWVGASLSQMQRPAEMIMVADGIGYGYASSPSEDGNEITPTAFSTYWSGNPSHNTNVYEYIGLTADPPYWPAGTSAADAVYPRRSCFVGRHFGKAQCGFADGHVAPMDVAVIGKTNLFLGSSASTSGGYVWRYLQRGTDGS